MSARQTLGRGFDSLIPKDLDPSLLLEDEERIQKLLIQDIIPNPDQPRRQFEELGLRELTDSIKQHGVLQPIIVVRHGGSGQYRIVAGERRWRAASAAKLTKIPAVVRSLEELEQLELALIENVQRVDLSPLEQALAVLKLQQQFNLSLEIIAKKLGKAPSTVSNMTRLLQLPEIARQALRDGKISEGHARAILALKSDSTAQNELLSSILNNNWTVRQAEDYVLRHKRAIRGGDNYDELALTREVSSKLSTQVKIKHAAKGGQIIITFKNGPDLKRILNNLEK
jgi:ParB family transcriptional regulator, chromosome partitioning protein